MGEGLCIWRTALFPFPPSHIKGLVRPFLPLDHPFYTIERPLICTFLTYVFPSFWSYVPPLPPRCSATKKSRRPEAVSPPSLSDKSPRSSSTLRFNLYTPLFPLVFLVFCACSHPPSLLFCFFYTFPSPSLPFPSSFFLSALRYRA